MALRAEDEERRAVHDQGVAPVLNHQMRQRIIIILCPYGRHTQTRQEHGECGQAKWKE